MNLARQDEIEQELNQEKKKFVDASQKATQAIRRDLNVMNWLRQYPTESAVVMIAAGFTLGYVIQQRRVS